MYYRDFGSWMREIFPFKVQKISINAGFTCPNRDGRISSGGCTFCDNRTFNPSYCHPQQSITRQLEDGKLFFGRKYPEMRYLAYFQAYTNTYASLPRLQALYEEALAVSDVVGIVIGTRPDCVSDTLLDYLQSLARHTFVMVEYGVESANDTTLKRINRGHTFACSQDAIRRTHERNIFTGAHVILGLPGEDAEECLRQAPLISDLPIDVLKLHQLQIVKGTRLAEDYIAHPFPLYDIDDYLDLIVKYIRIVRTDMVYDRFVSQCPPELLIAPRWGVKNYQFTEKLNKRLSR